MAHVMIDRSSAASRWMAVTVVVCLTAGAAGMWWLMQSPRASEESASSVAEPAVTADQQAEIQQLAGEQTAAASVVTRQPELKPVDRHLTERPEYVSPMEWAMLQGVAQQDADPPRMLARLVNSLRFTRQTEVWESLPKTSDQAIRRGRLAEQLLQDLPNRVLQGDLALDDAQSRLVALLADAVPSPDARQTRQHVELARLQAAHAAYQASMQASASSPSDTR